MNFLYSFIDIVDLIISSSLFHNIFIPVFCLGFVSIVPFFIRYFFRR